MEVAQGPAPSAAGPFVLNLKASQGRTPKQLGWGLSQIAGHQIASHTMRAGKGRIGGIDQVVWQTSGTMLVLSPSTLTPNGASPGLTEATVNEVVTNLTIG